MSDRVYAAITAGGRVDGKFAERLGTRVKALAPIGPQSLLEIAIQALKGAGVEGIAVVGGAEVRTVCHTLVDRIIDETQDGVENMRRALNAWGGERTLYMTSDLPFVCASEILSFQRSSRPEAITMPVADQETYNRAFPGAPPHITALGPERVAGGSVFLFPAGAAAQIEKVAGAFFRCRKSAFRMALLLGPALVVRYLTKRLRIVDIEKRAHRMLKVPALVVRGSYASLCCDVDSLEDYEYALKYFS